MPTDLLILIAALIVSWLVFTALIKIVKTTVGTIAIAAIVLVLQLVFGINLQDWQQICLMPTD